MDRITRTQLDHLASEDGELRYQALLSILQATDQQVDWAYDVWDGLVENLRHKDNHQRAIAAQVLCNLAKSDHRTECGRISERC
jgi:hypothetical protein